jgi:hypothetical protein
MAGPMQMPTRRFLFLRPRRKATLAPIHIALLSRSFEGSYLPPPAPPKPSRSGTWM